MTFILLKRESKYSESKREMKTNKYRTLKRIYQRLKNTESPLIQNESRGFSKKRRLPTLPLLRSTIGVTRLNFSVRNGKRWNPRAITT